MIKLAILRKRLKLVRFFHPYFALDPLVLEVGGNVEQRGNVFW